MFRAIKYELKPNKSQKKNIKEICESCRIVYNVMLERKINAEKLSGVVLSAYDLIKQLWSLKYEYKFLNDSPNQALQQAIYDLDFGYRKFKKKRPTDFPKFKLSTKNGSFRIPKPCTIDYNNWKIEVEKIGTIKFFKGHNKPINGKIKWYTISYTSTDRFFISVLYEADDITKFNYNKSVGIDVGVKNLATLSDGKVIENQKYLKSNLKKLKVLQRSVSRKYQKGKTREQQSNNWKKAVKKLAKLHEHIAFQRRDYLHQVSTKISNNYSTVCVETLDIKKMLENHKLAQAIQDCGWRMFLNMLEYKCDNLVKIDLWYPSSKTCNKCGYVNYGLTLNDREWTCPNCGEHHDRDLNAAINIEKEGRQILKSKNGYDIFDPIAVVRKKVHEKFEKLSANVNRKKSKKPKKNKKRKKLIFP